MQYRVRTFNRKLGIAIFAAVLASCQLAPAYAVATEELKAIKAETKAVKEALKNEKARTKLAKAQADLEKAKAQLAATKEK